MTVSQGPPVYDQNNGITEPSQKVIVIIQVKNHGSLVSERKRHLK